MVLPEYWNTRGSVNPYCFMEVLFSALRRRGGVSGDGPRRSPASRLAEEGQRSSNSGSAPMGFDLPAAIGAAVATGGRVVCLAGDGSIQMNLQELQTIVTHRLPIKIFVLNNRGYHSIRQTQHNYFPDNIVGCGTESAAASPTSGSSRGPYGIPFRRVGSALEGLPATCTTPSAATGPQIWRGHASTSRRSSPRLRWPRAPPRRRPDDLLPPLEDLAPFLSRDELRENMLVPLLPDE